MGFKHLHLKLKVFRLRQVLLGKKRKSKATQKPSWMVPISHGYHTIEDREGGMEGEEDSGTVVVQREEIDKAEVWFFGVSDSGIGHGITKYVQSHFFDRKLKESEMRRKSKETMKKAYMGAKAEMKEKEKAAGWGWGSASAIVMNGEKMVLANMGDYRAVLCRDGVAFQIGFNRPQRSWTHKLLSGAFMPKVGKLACNPGSGGDDSQPPKGSGGVLVSTKRIDADTEFVILASSGIWEVMKNQEAVNLIRHIEDAQEAAECLAKEALTRVSRSNISCLVIHFD